MTKLKKYTWWLVIKSPHHQTKVSHGQIQAEFTILSLDT